jgi:hypothetical protein
MSKRYLPFIAIPVALLIAGAVGAGATGDDNNPPSADITRVTSIEPEARQALDVLDEGRGPGDALPEDLSSRMKERASFGMNPALSRRAIGNVTSSVYVIPARDHVCVSLTDSDGATVICPTTDDVVKGTVEPATVASASGAIAIYGIVPDGVDSISIQIDGDDSIEVATEDNVYYTVVPSGIALRKVSYVGPSGSVDFKVHDPARVMGAQRP